MKRKHAVIRKVSMITAVFLFAAITLTGETGEPVSTAAADGTDIRIKEAGTCIRSGMAATVSVCAGAAEDAWVQL